MLVLRRRARLQGDVSDEADEQRFVGAHAEELADGRPRFLGAVGRGAGEPDAGVTAADRIDLAQESDLRHRLSPCWLLNMDRRGRLATPTGKIPRTSAQLHDIMA